MTAIEGEEDLKVPAFFINSARIFVPTKGVVRFVFHEVYADTAFNIRGSFVMSHEKAVEFIEVMQATLAGAEAAHG